MIQKNNGKVIGHHYTSSRAYRSMETKGINGWKTAYDVAGLIPRRRFIDPSRANGLPGKAHERVIEGLLEPEPECWTSNPEFPNLWYSLFHSICQEPEIMLLKFEILPFDEAYVINRAHVERELYKESEKSTKESLNKAYRKYFESRIPVHEYDHEYDVPQLAIWSPIEFDRLDVVWKKSRDEVWNRILAKGW